MSSHSDQRSEEFLKISDQFKLGALVTESSHPVTANLSDTARQDAAAGCRMLFEVDEDVLATYRSFAVSGRAAVMQRDITRALRAGGKLFFTGCGSTGRLSIQLVSIWRAFWQRQTAGPLAKLATDLEQRAHAVMAGGDFALIKAVEGFEDFTAFGKKQIGDLGVSEQDVVFAITEGGETSFVIGTAWKGVEVGARVYFVYNNPDEILCERVQRSREVIQEPRIEKVNLTTGPMGITGSTRMQATTIQLAVMLTVLEMAVREMLQEIAPKEVEGLLPETVLDEWLAGLPEALHGLRSTEVLQSLGRLVELEEAVYRSGHRNNYFADGFGIDVLTDTTERSPTYCTPPFRKFEDVTATESWAYLYVNAAETPRAWERIIKRVPRCVEWPEQTVRQLVPPDKADRTCEIIRKISYPELMCFRVGLDGLTNRLLGSGDSTVGIVGENELDSLVGERGFHRMQLEAAGSRGARLGVIYIGSKASQQRAQEFLASWQARPVSVMATVPQNRLLLEGLTRVTLKTLLNTLSTCTMVRLGRVMGNYMIWVVPSNLKLIDRATRYIQKLTGLDYRPANRLLFEVIEYVEPRMKADQAYPPVVGVAVMRHRHGISNIDAEQRLMAELKR
jgi:N-acetylmuramic acid 6-phosphate etherase